MIRSPLSAGLARAGVLPRLARAATLGAALLVAACHGEEAVTKPAAVEMTSEALGYYCQMYLADHGGPKAQILIRGEEHPLWFTQVADAVAYLKGRERIGETAAVYVTDMEKAPSWSEPGRNNWIDADAAFFVVGSRRMGGMGQPEAIPFGTEHAAFAFMAENGGHLLKLDAIPESYVRADGATISAGDTPTGDDIHGAH